MSQTQLEGLKDADGAAAYFGVSRRTIDRMKASGQLPYVKFPGVRRALYRLEDLEQFAAKHTVKPKRGAA